MRRRLKRLLLIGLSVTLALPPPAFPASTALLSGRTCLSGECINGYGTVRGKYGDEFTGNWSNSGFTAGRYRVRYAEFPSQHLDIVIDAQRYPLEGTVYRGWDDGREKQTLYTGTFAKVYNPFEKKYVPHYARGRYTDASGVVYDGDFDYVPKRAAVFDGNYGYYIFQGVRINEEADQVRPGLYISDSTDGEVLLGEIAARLPISFHRATPDYIVKLQDDLRKDIQEAAAEEAAKLTRERESRENLKSLFTTVLGFAAVVGVVTVASRYSGRSASVSALGDTMMGKQTSQDAASNMVGELRERAKTDPALAKRIGKSTDAELVTMMKRAGSTAPTSMSMAEYRNASSKTAVQQDASGPLQNEQARREQGAISYVSPKQPATPTGRVGPQSATSTSPNLQVQKGGAPQVVMSSWPEKCPPGYSPARHSNGVKISAADGAYCIKDSEKAAESVASQDLGNSTKSSSDDAYGTGQGKKDAAGKSPGRKTIKKTPTNPPKGTASESLAKANGDYNCVSINSYANQYAKAAEQRFDDYISAAFRSEERCQARCDLLAWREEVITVYNYRGSWSCSVSVVGLWNSLDAGARYSSYRDGNNDDLCTCVSSSDLPLRFSP